MTNKQTLAALQEALNYADTHCYDIERRYTALRGSVMVLIAALEVDVKDVV